MYIPEQHYNFFLEHFFITAVFIPPISYIVQLYLMFVITNLNSHVINETFSYLKNYMHKHDNVHNVHLRFPSSFARLSYFISVGASVILEEEVSEIFVYGKKKYVSYDYTKYFSSKRSNEYFICYSLVIFYVVSRMVEDSVT